MLERRLSIRLLLDSVDDLRGYLSDELLYVGELVLSVGRRRLQVLELLDLISQLAILLLKFLVLLLEDPKFCESFFQVGINEVLVLVDLGRYLDSFSALREL